MAYLKRFFLTIGSILCLVGAIDYLIDPFDLWNPPRIERVNTIKSVGNPRFVKPLQVERRKPETVLLGTSRAFYGIDPHDLADGDRIYNLGMPAATATEIAGYGFHVLADTDAKRLIIGLDFFSFNDMNPPDPAYDDAVLGRHAVLRAAPIVLFTQAALERSWRTIRASRRGIPADFHHDGFAVIPPVPGKDGTTIAFQEIYRFLHTPYLFGHYDSFERSLADYRTLLIAAKAKGLDVITYISPEHASLTEAVHVAGLWPKLKEWKRRLLSLQEPLGIPLWDFSGYNRLTVTPFGGDMETHVDGSHFRPWIGRLVIERIRGAAEPADFGVSLTPANIEAHLSQIDRDRETYLAKRPDDVAKIISIAHSP